jgi:hypothetical protein
VAELRVVQVVPSSWGLGRTRVAAVPLVLDALFVVADLGQAVLVSQRLGDHFLLIEFILGLAEPHGLYELAKGDFSVLVLVETANHFEHWAQIKQVTKSY